MTKNPSPSDQEAKLRRTAQLHNQVILARSLVSGGLFALLLLALDWIQLGAVNLVQTTLLAVIFAVILGVYDLFMRASARSRLDRH